MFLDIPSLLVVLARTPEPLGMATSDRHTLSAVADAAEAASDREIERAKRRHISNISLKSMYVRPRARANNKRTNTRTRTNDRMNKRMQHMHTQHTRALFSLA